MDPHPARLRLSRRKGFELQSHSRATNGLAAARICRPGKWGNIYRVGLVACGCRSAGECDHNAFRCDSVADAVEAYRVWAAQWRDTSALRGALGELRGKNLACWCALDSLCHGDVLLELANRPEVGSAP